MAERPFSRSGLSTASSDRQVTAAGSRPMTSNVEMPVPFQRPDTTRQKSAAPNFQGEGGVPSRPTTSGRPATSRPASSALRRAPSTASRLISTAAMQRPSTRTGVATGIGFTTPINVIDRPITQQGLSGMKTGSKGPQRQVQDKSYYMGLLRTKIGNMSSEIQRLCQETETMKQEQSSFLTYDKKVKEVAQELTALQGNLADYNMLIDLMNTDTEQSEVNEDMKELKDENDQQINKLDTIFTQKQDRESLMRQLENEIQEERHMGENLVEAMQPELREQYMEDRNMNGVLLQSLDIMQQKIDSLDAEKLSLQDELSVSTVKQEAVELFTNLQELEEKRNEIIGENQKRGTPQEERDKLIMQVKEDNGEIATMERKLGEVHEDIGRAQEDLHHLDQELEENKSERSQKYRELRKREETMEQFMETFDKNKEEELSRLNALEGSIVMLLDKMSRTISYFGNLPSTKDFSMMRTDLNFKKDELQKSQYTETSLKSEHMNLQVNLQKIEALETKVKKEKIDIENKLVKMEKEYQTFLDIQGLKKKMEEKRMELAQDKDELDLKKQSITQSLKDISNQISVVEKQLKESETNSQLQNLEKKWAHLEQNNFVLKEFIAQKRAESNFIPLKNQAMKLVVEYNKALQEVFQGGGTLA